MEKRNSLLVLATILCLASLAAASSGTATYYTAPYTPSACYGNTNEGTMIAAASDVFWNNGGACGHKYSVKCTGATNGGGYPCNGNSVIVKIVDYCPSGCAGTIDLSQEAFAAIANLDAGKIKIEYTRV